MYRIEKFHISRLDDWYDYFDKHAFSDNPGWQSCYCTYFHSPKNLLMPDGKRFKTNRDYAGYLLEQNILQGYIALDDENRIIGWCNTNQRNSFPRIVESIGQTIAEDTISITCFVIAKEHRGKGISKLFINRIIQDAGLNGIRYIEAYPKKRARSDSGNFHGYFKTYQKFGFNEETINNMLVMRIDIKGETK